MTTFLLVIIYLAFISLGLPDSLLGAAWPVMQADFGVPLETAGILFMTIAGGTIISSLVSGKVLKRFGTGKVTFVSVFMTAGALLGFNFAPSVTVLVNLHQVDVALKYSDKIIGINQGQVVYNGVPKNITKEDIQRIYGSEAEDLIFDVGGIHAS